MGIHLRGYLSFFSEERPSADAVFINPVRGSMLRREITINFRVTTCNSMLHAFSYNFQPAVCKNKRQSYCHCLLTKKKINKTKQKNSDY